MEKSGYKQTELGLLPNCWGIESVENMFLKARIGWQGLTTSEYLIFGDYCLVTGTDINGGVVNWKNCFYVEKNRYDQDKNIQLKNGDLLITKDGTIGKVAIVEELKKPATLNSGIFVLREKVFPINSKYLYYVFLSKLFKKFISDLTAGSTIVHLYQKDFVKFKFPYPDIKEQKNIAEALSNIDELISNQEKLIEKKRAIKQGVMQELLKQGNYISIGQICNVVKGDIITENDIEQGNIPVIAGGKTPAYYHSKANRNANVITISASGASAGYVAFHDYPIFASDCSTISYSDEYDVRYIYYSLLLNQGEITKMQTGGAQPHIHPKDIEQVKIHLPKLDVQKKVANILTDVDKEITEQEQKLEKYKQLKQAMMEQLLTGKIRLI